MSYGDEDTLYAGRMQVQIVEGIYPQTVDEAAVSSAYLEKFFPGSGVGDQITVPFEGKEYPFTVSAILSSPDTGVEAYSVMVSQSFLKEQPGYDPSGYNAYVHIKGADSYYADDLKRLGTEIRDRLGLRSVSYSSIYFSVSRTIQPENILQLTAVVLVVMLGGSMVIRSIFRISVLEKIQNYGQLRTLGPPSGRLNGCAPGEPVSGLDGYSHRDSSWNRHRNSAGIQSCLPAVFPGN